MNPEFQVHRLNEDGIRKANSIAGIFDSALGQLEQYCLQDRYFAIVRTKLEEACFFAKKSMARYEPNQVKS